MKIVAILNQTIDVGGGFSQSWNAVLQMARLCKGRFDFEVVSTVDQPKEWVASVTPKVTIRRVSAFDNLIASLLGSAFGSFARAKVDWRHPFERMLEGMGADLVYFLGPSRMALALGRLNYIFTVWDTCHRDASEFPEVRDRGEFQRRENVLRAALPFAYLVLVDAPISSRRLTSRYGIDPERMLPMPFAPAPWIAPVDDEKLVEVLQRYALQPGYYFYPAQFWAHKNHACLVASLRRMHEQGVSATLVLVGSDKANRARIERLVADSGLTEDVRFLGFVPVEDLSALYQGARSVVMPTYFGPTNLPPLEAWKLGVPLIYTEYFRDQTGDAALLVDPDDAESLCEAMLKVRDPDIARALTQRGLIRLSQIDRERCEAEASLLSALLRFQVRRSNWQ